MKYTEMFYRYLGNCKKSNETIKTYEYTLNKIMKDLEVTEEEFINLPLEVFREYIDILIDNGMEANSINKKIATMNSFFSFLIAMGVVKINTTKQLGKLKIERKRVKFLEVDDAQKLLDVVENDYISKLNKVNHWVSVRDRFMINLMLATGLRVFEVRDLKTEDIDLNNGLLIVERGKGDKYRELLVPEKVLDMYKEWMDIRETFEIKKEDVEYIFISRQSKQLDKRQMQNVVTKYAKMAGVNITSHGLRHTFATLLVNEDVDMKDIASALGHTLESTTEAIYVHATRKNLQRCRDNNPLFK